MAMALGFLVVLALAAEEVNAQCSLSAMAPCYSAVTGAYPPQPAGGPSGSCCAAVRTANPACMCSQFQQGSYPPNMIRNAFAMPRVCQRYDIRGYRCGGVYLLILARTSQPVAHPRVLEGLPKLVTMFRPCRHNIIQHLKIMCMG